MLPPLTWQIFQTIVDYLSPIVSACVFNQLRGHWFLNYVLHSAISMNLKLMEENQVLPLFESLMDDDLVVSAKLSLLASNIKREVINVMDSFISFLKVYDKKKTHNMIFLTLNLRYKNLRIISLFIGREQGVVLVEEHDRKSLYPTLVKCHEHLHPLMRLERNFVDQDIFLLGL
jgi:hypothetical protein